MKTTVVTAVAAAPNATSDQQGTAAAVPVGVVRSATFRGVPVRVRIMGWLVLLLAVALLSVVLVTRNLLLNERERDTSASLVQEIQEFETFAAVGRNPETGLPLEGAEELLRLHLSRQRPNDNEVLLGVSRDGTFGTLAQGGSDAVGAVTTELGAAIVNDPAGQGAAATSRGELRWSRVPIRRGAGSGGAPDGYFVVGRLIDPDRAVVRITVQTMSLVSAIGLLLAAGAAWIVSGQLLEPVRLVRRAAAEITEDDLTRRITVYGRDDIAALAEQFNGMLDRLEGAFGTQRAFIDDASHELRTPITIIRGHLELMSDDDAVEAAEVRRLCIDELDRMSRIVDDLLLLAKSERPDFVRPQKVELAELTSDIDAKVRALGERRWRLETIGEGPVRLDPQRVTQAVVQFAHNAVQHTRVGDEIRIGSARRADRVSVWITDSGSGVAPEDAQVIFERFSRGSTGSRGDRAGAGLGLAIVKAIAEAHGGSVSVRSPPGAGATFSIEVPVRPRSAP